MRQRFKKRRAAESPETSEVPVEDGRSCLPRRPEGRRGPYGAVDDGAVRLSLPAFVRKELGGSLDCGLLCRGFARLCCDGCSATRLVALACTGRGCCPSCLGRKTSATAANLVDCVMPKVALRPWGLTVPFAWRAARRRFTPSTYRSQPASGAALCYRSSVDALLESSVKLEAQKSPGQKLAEALELMDWGIRMKRARLREQHPEADEGEIDGLLMAWLCRHG